MELEEEVDIVGEDYYIGRGTVRWTFTDTYHRQVYRLDKEACRHRQLCR